MKTVKIEEKSVKGQGRVREGAGRSRKIMEVSQKSYNIEVPEEIYTL